MDANAIIRLLNIIHKALVRIKFPIGLFIDLWKAFDIVNHNYLLNFTMVSEA